LSRRCQRQTDGKICFTTSSAVSAADVADRRNVGLRNGPDTDADAGATRVAVAPLWRKRDAQVGKFEAATVGHDGPGLVPTRQLAEAVGSGVGIEADANHETSLAEEASDQQRRHS
jgi:hypothetical protein